MTTTNEASMPVRPFLPPPLPERVIDQLMPHGLYSPNPAPLEVIHRFAWAVQEEVLARVGTDLEAPSVEAQPLVTVADLIRAYNSGYMSGHHDTVEGQFTDILHSDMATYHSDVVADLIEDGTLAAPQTPTPASQPSEVAAVLDKDGFSEQRKPTL